MRRMKRIVLFAGLLALAPVLAGCENFDMDSLDVFHLNEKKKLPGERKELFPSGVPGVSQGIPPEYLKGNQPPADASLTPDVPAAAAAPGDKTAAPAPAAKTAAIEPAAEPKVKPKRKPKPRTAAPLLHRHARVVRDLLAQPGEPVEERRLPRVRRTDQRHEASGRARERGKGEGGEAQRSKGRIAHVSMAMHAP
jgi:hypothetical protein